MAITLELMPKLEARLRLLASHRGVSAEEYARELLEASMGPAENLDQDGRHFSETATDEEWEREFDEDTEWLRGLNLPDLPDEALRRENMYEDRGL